MEEVELKIETARKEIIEDTKKLKAELDKGIPTDGLAKMKHISKVSELEGKINNNKRVIELKDELLSNAKKKDAKKKQTETPTTEVKEGKITKGGKEITKEELKEEYRKNPSSLEDFGDYIEYEGGDNQTTEAVELTNERRDPKFKDSSQYHKGKYKSTFIESLLVKHLENKGARSLAHYIR